MSYLSDTDSFRKQFSSMEQYCEAANKMNEKEDKIRAALEVLRERDSGVLFVHCLIREHRTHQQSIIRNLFEALAFYSKSSTDLRNEAAVEWAQKATKENTYFPFV